MATRMAVSLSPRARAGQQEIRDVDAGNEKYERDRTE